MGAALGRTGLWTEWREALRAERKMGELGSPRCCIPEEWGLGKFKDVCNRSHGDEHYLKDFHQNMVRITI